jgi:hypothetical protein
LQIFQKSPSDLIRTPPRAPVSSFCQLWASGSYFALVCLEGLPAPSEEQKPDERAQGKVGDDLMMLQSLAALDRSQVPDDAVMAVAHSSQMAVLEVPHAVSMHWPAIPSILDRAESIQSKYRAAGSVAARAYCRRWRQILFPSEYGPAVQQRRGCALPVRLAIRCRDSNQRMATDVRCAVRI